ncbi:hypothetical protein QR680_008553 [Steinernema hermaphroditum]|uniref:Target of rapamycin complex subunit lst8 n=1 Tax=Steinernema hermaphroditum TaxID=289476 RepID=A0AA39M8A9_9BILA|nr:hypothetical protein QR680_008553 [Steinernema hermaphroditum]
MHPILASASYDATIRFWDLQSGNPIESVTNKDGQVNAMEISPDGTLMALAGWQNLRLIDLYKKMTIANVDAQSLARNVTSLCFVPESTRLLSGGEDQRIRLWNTRGGQLQCEKFIDLPAVINSVCVHPNQTTVFATDGQGCAYQWDTRTHQPWPIPISGMNFGEHFISIAVNSIGNKVTAASNHGRLFTWDISAGSIDAKQVIQAHDTYITRVRYTPNGERLATTSADGSVCIWDANNLENGKPLAKYEEKIPENTDKSKQHSVGWVWDCAFTSSSSSKYMIAASTDGILRIWDMPAARVHRYCKGHNKPITAMAFRDVF